MLQQKLIVNGGHTENGLHVRNHVPEDSKHDLGISNNKLSMAVQIVKGNLQVFEFAMNMPVQVNNL